MNAIETVKAIESSQLFAQWKKANPNACLTSVFAMFSKGEEREWLVTYYDSGKEKMTTFSLKDAKSSEEPFSRSKEIPELRLDEVKISDSKAMEIADETFRKDYGNETVQKAIMVLQKLNAKALWNITLVTAALKVVNIKVAASSGTVLDHSISPISGFMQKK